MLDAVVIGGGFYGVSIASYLVERRGFGAVALLERESGLLRRASLVNQARVHNGYHYPRSFTTAFRSRINLPRFVADHPQCVMRNFDKVYAIARRNSKVTARQFRRFCADVGARLEPLPDELRPLFDRSLIEEAFLVEEFAFDAARLGEWAVRCMRDQSVDLRLGTHVRAVHAADARGGLTVSAEQDGAPLSLEARFVFNCSYAGLNQIGGDAPRTRTALKHEITEMALLRPPAALARLGITVMDGAFFSTMPYPARRAHSLSHVRYTPHLQWLDQGGGDPYARLQAHAASPRADWMLRDARRYVPALADAGYLGSLFEVKTVLAGNEVDDGRPILFERHAALPGCFSILGGKIDNIYDAFERLDAEAL